jgi:hypothetical protein
MIHPLHHSNLKTSTPNWLRQCFRATYSNAPQFVTPELSELSYACHPPNQPRDPAEIVTAENKRAALADQAKTFSAGPGSLQME